MDTYSMEYDAHDISNAVASGFDYLERKDEIVGSVYARPPVVKEIVLAVPEDVTFEFVPEGIGMIRTAYLKMVPQIRENEIRFINQEHTVCLRVFLKD